MLIKKRLAFSLGVLVACLFVALGVFSVHAFLGDINLDNLVNTSDLELVRQAFGSTEWGGYPNWNPFADLDIDGLVDVSDLAIAGRSVGSDHIFHYPRQVSNSTSGVHNDQAACLDGLDRLNVVWVQRISPSTEKAFFSRLDRFGNTLIDDYLLRSGSASISDVAVGCDDSGNAHVIWQCPQGLCQARFDAWGFPVIPPSVAYDQGITSQLAIDLDSQGNSHAFFRRYSPNRQIYARFNTEGEFVLGSQGLLSGSSTNPIYRDIELDSEDNVHLMWYELEGLDRVYYSRLSAGASQSISDTLIGYTGYDGSVNDSREPALAVDADNNAFILYPNTTVDKLYLDKSPPMAASCSMIMRSSRSGKWAVIPPIVKSPSTATETCTCFRLPTLTEVFSTAHMEISIMMPTRSTRCAGTFMVILLITPTYWSTLRMMFT